MAERKIGVALLAAGASRRFGEADKLLADFRGMPLGEHAAKAIPLDQFERAWIVTASDAPTWQPEEFEPLTNLQTEEGMGTSVALAARAAREANLDALLIALADMPIVPRVHFQSLVEMISDSTSIACSQKGNSRMPPAVFGSAHFDALAQLGQDEGARALLAKAEIVNCPAEWLIDIDTQQALQTYGQAGAHAPKPASKGET